MLSDDCLVIPGAIINGYNLFEEKLKKNERVGAIAFFYRDWPDQIKYHVQTYWGVINVNHGLYLKKALESVNYVDEDTYHFYSGDIDLVFKLLSNNYSSIFSDNSFIEHYTHTNSKIRKNNIQYGYDDFTHFIKKWGSTHQQIKLENSLDQIKQIEFSFNDEQKTIQLWEKIFKKNFILLIRHYLSKAVIFKRKFNKVQ
ncbi:MAG: hypothetical protein GX638_15360 [Crenarchaeota archaeon]|nr:hypothetical protein [Thermoproteota archaeon]